MHVCMYAYIYIYILLMVQKLNCHNLSIFPNSSPMLYLYKSLVISYLWHGVDHIHLVNLTSGTQKTVSIKWFLDLRVPCEMSGSPRYATATILLQYIPMCWCCCCCCCCFIPVLMIQIPLKLEAVCVSFW